MELVSDNNRISVESRNYGLIEYELQRAPNGDSNQPTYLLSLFTVFVVRKKNFAFLAIQNTPSEDSDLTARI